MGTKNVYREAKKATYIMKMAMESVRRRRNNNDNEGWGEKGGYRRTPTQDTPPTFTHCPPQARICEVRTLQDFK